MEKMVFSIVKLLLLFLYAIDCQESIHLHNTEINKILQLNRGSSDRLPKPYADRLGVNLLAQNITEIKENSNSLSSDEVCAGPELCPLCWEPVLHSIITDLSYNLPSDKEMESFYQRNELYRVEIPNNTSSKIIANATFSKLLLNNFHWEFQSSQNISVKTILSTRIPFPTPERDSDASFYAEILDIISNNTISWSEYMEYSGTKEILIAPYEIANVVAYSKWVPEQLVIPFVSQMEFISPKMAACWICNNNGYVCMEASLSGQNISDILSRKGFNGEIIEVRQSSVVTSVRGTFSGSYGTHTTFVVKNEPRK